MKSLKEGQNKIQEICDALKKETLEPAQKEAQRIIVEANERAQEILEEAKQQAEGIVANVKKDLEQERNVFNSSLLQATKQSLESLKQAIENKLFNDQLLEALDKPLKDPQVIANLINELVKAIEKEGLSTDLSVIIPKSVSTEAVNQLLLNGMVNKLREKGVVVGSMGGGVEIKLHDKKMSIDLTDATLKELLANYIRKDFRKLVFAS